MLSFCPFRLYVVNRGRTHNRDRNRCLSPVALARSIESDPIDLSFLRGASMESDPIDRDPIDPMQMSRVAAQDPVVALNLADFLRGEHES